MQWWLGLHEGRGVAAARCPSHPVPRTAFWTMGGSPAISLARKQPKSQQSRYGSVRFVRVTVQSLHE